MTKSMKRRSFLKGAGSVMIALPLFEENMMARALAQSSAVPERCLTMSFGLGIERALQDEKWDGPLEPFRPTWDKMTFFSNLKNNHLEGGGTAHFEVGATQFTGIKQNGTRQANGPSLEQLMRLRLHPNGVPSVTGLPSMSAGIWSRTGATPQYTRHWNANGSPGPRPQRRPSKVFDALFGSYMPGDGGGGTDAETEKERRIRRSVLDSVLDQANSLTGVNSYLGQASKEKIKIHLDEIRALEKQLVDGDLADNQMTQGEVSEYVPQQSDYQDPGGISFYDAKSGATTGPKVDWQAAEKAFRLSGKLFALGFYTDALRFGSMIYVGAGGHIRFTGQYEAKNIGKSLNFSNVFDNRSPHDGIFHNYVKDSIRVYQHYVVSQLAYVLQEMDKLVEPNGKTVLDNTLTVIGTEYGRNHDSGKGIFHAVVGGAGRFKPGQHNQNYGFNDVYKTLMDAYGIDHDIGGSTIGGILA